MGQQAGIESIELFNGTDCCTNRLSNVHVFVADHDLTDGTLNKLLADESVDHQYIDGAVGESAAIPLKTTGRYVRVQLAGTGYLQLAEVRVNGYPAQIAQKDERLVKEMFQEKYRISLRTPLGQIVLRRASV